MRVKRSLTIVACGLVLGCTEPNPYAQQDTGDSSTTGDPTTGDPTTGTDTTGDPPGCGDPACSLGLEVIEFSLQGNNPFSAQIPKPADQATVPIAAVHRYDPGQSDNLGFTIAWTDNGDSWTVEVTPSNAAPNSRLAGVAAVIGLGADFPAPEVHELEITTADGCGELSTTALAGRLFIDVVERYEPGDAAVFEFSRTATIADTAAIEYCVTQPDQLDATLGVKLVAFDLPEGALAQTSAVTLDAAGGATDSFTELGTVSTVAHLIGAQSLVEAPGPALGWAIDCAGQAPYACNYDLLGFVDGVAVEVGGAVLALE